MLLAKPGELVTREELCQKLWPAGTFVDFENGLNTATNRLRVALSDSAETPRYIETLPRLGYRFICPVSRVDESEPVGVVSDVVFQIERNTASPANAAESRLDTLLPSPPSPREIKGTYSGLHKFGRFWRTLAITIAVLILVVLVFGYLRSIAAGTRTQPTFRQVTFRSGVVRSGRFAPDATKIVYTAKWGGADQQTYLMNLGSFASRSLGLAPGALVSVSSKGDLAFVYRDRLHLNSPVRLSRISAKGGAAQTIAEGAKAADWAPNGRDLAIVREVGPESLIEFPVGKVVYSSQGWITYLRVSPGGEQIAFLEHPVRDDDAGHVRLVDAKGNSRVLTGEWNSIEGLAWASSGKEVWFTASKDGAAHALYSVSKDSKLRMISDTPSSLRLLDISSKGRVLMAVDDTRMTMRGAPDLKSAESDLSHFDLSHVDDISSDGKLVLLTEGGEGGGQHYTSYVHDQKSGKTFRVGPGRGLAISSDGQSVLTVDPQDRRTLTIISIASQNQTKIQGNGFQYQWAKFLPHGKTLLVGGAYPGETLKICTQLIAGGDPVPLTGLPYMDFVTVSPDGSRIAGVSSDRSCLVFDITDHEARPVSSAMDSFPVAWSSDNSDLYALIFRDSVNRIVKTNLQTGKVNLWKTITLGDSAGILGVAGIAIAPATGAYAYSTGFNLSSLYLVDGLS
jgi:eukaryotic-like serine/threonine-protein kinase